MSNKIKTVDSAASLQQQQQHNKNPAPPFLTEILPNRLYISNIEGASDVARVVSLGITHVVAVLKTKITNPYPPNIQRLWMPVVDTATAVDGFEKLWPTPLQFLRECMDKGGRAMVHCRAGMSRSSTIVLAHMLDYHHFLLKDAWTLLYTKHPIASPIFPFFNALISYEGKLYKSFHGSPTNPYPNPACQSFFQSSQSDASSKKSAAAAGGADGSASTSNASSTSTTSSSPSSTSSSSPSSSTSAPAPGEGSRGSQAQAQAQASAPTPASASAAAAAAPTGPYKPSITLLEYQLQMLHTIFPTTRERDFYDVLRQCGGNWLTAARVYHQYHPASLSGFAMQYGGGASPYHPFCDGI